MIEIRSKINTEHRSIDEIDSIDIRRARCDDIDEFTSIKEGELCYVFTFKNGLTVLYSVSEYCIRPFGNTDVSSLFSIETFDSVAKQHYENYAADCVKDREERKSEELRILKENMSPKYFKKVKGGVLDGVAKAYTADYIYDLRKKGYTEITKEDYARVTNDGNVNSSYISYDYE